MMIYGGSKGGGNTSSSSTSGSKQEQVATSFKMNEVAQNGDLAFTVTKVTEANL